MDTRIQEVNDRISATSQEVNDVMDPTALEDRMGLTTLEEVNDNMGPTTVEEENDSTILTTTLEDVWLACEKEEDKIFPPVRCFVVNYTTTMPHPKQFLYKACSRRISKDRFCDKSLDHAFCGHFPVEGVDSFRFDIIMGDGSGDGRPVRGTIYGASARLLLDISPLELKALGEREQRSAVHETLVRIPLVDVSLRTSGGCIYVQDLLMLNRVSIRPRARPDPMEEIDRSLLYFSLDQDDDKGDNVLLSSHLLDSEVEELLSVLTARGLDQNHEELLRLLTSHGLDSHYEELRMLLSFHGLN